MRSWLKLLRKERGLKQEDVAKELGVAANHYSMIECGLRKKNLDLPFMKKLSEFFGVSIEFIIEKETEGN